jgi:hypothetical protein
MPKAMALARPAAAVQVTQKGVVIPPELTPRQFALLLMHIEAELEHVLMVEYLYAGYSLGGPQVPGEYRECVTQWQEVILGIAKEEMGHLMTAQISTGKIIPGIRSSTRFHFGWSG